MHELHAVQLDAPIYDANVPLVQLEQVVRPVRLPNVPTGQRVHIDAPPVEYAPTAQSAVQLAVVRPVVFPNVPAGHGVHAGVAAPPVEKAPEGQGPEPAADAAPPVE